MISLVTFSTHGLIYPQGYCNIVVLYFFEFYVSIGGSLKGGRLFYKRKVRAAQDMVVVNNDRPRG